MSGKGVDLPLQSQTDAPIGGVVFDLDGTLIDSCADIAAAANHCLANAGLPLRSEAQVRDYIGDGSRLLLQRASGLSADDARLDAMLQDFFAYYTEHAVDHTRLLPGARQVLEQLRHLPRALCTNKPRVTTEAVLAALGIAGDFDAVVAAGDVPETKPHPAPLRRIAELLRVDCSRLVLVGDGPQDVLCAHAAGARSIGISEALIVPLERLRAAQPEVLVALGEVPSVIERWQREREPARRPRTP
ncbi:MAG TPA: HAD-IA family hydrolase [Polyangiaceae bacterium]|nr:HAD-IA family hydrolase [Polyangiaceae bacterium]